MHSNNENTTVVEVGLQFTSASYVIPGSPAESRGLRELIWEHRDSPPCPAILSHVHRV